jgi:hypothetical protein
MAWRVRHSVASGALVLGGLVWAARDAWSGWPALSAPAIRVDRAYVDYADTLRRGETACAVLARAGLGGLEGEALLAAAPDLPVRRLRPGLVFHFRRLLTDSLPDRVGVRLTPERRLWWLRSDTGWVETAEAIPWTVSRLRVTGVIETSLYDALDRAMPDSFLPRAERHALAWALADVYD